MILNGAFFTLSFGLLITENPWFFSIYSTDTLLAFGFTQVLEVIRDLPVPTLHTNDSVAFTQDQKHRSAKP